MDIATLKRKKFREILNRRTLAVMPGGFSPLYRAPRSDRIRMFLCCWLADVSLSARCSRYGDLLACGTLSIMRVMSRAALTSRSFLILIQALAMP